MCQGKNNSGCAIRTAILARRTKDEILQNADKGGCDGSCACPMGKSKGAEHLDQVMNSFGNNPAQVIFVTPAQVSVARPLSQ